MTTEDDGTRGDTAGQRPPAPTPDAAREYTVPPPPGQGAAPGATVPLPGATMPLPDAPAFAAGAPMPPAPRPVQLPRALILGALTTAGVALAATVVMGLILALAAAAPLAQAMESLGSEYGAGSGLPSEGADVGALLGIVLVFAGMVLGGEVSVAASGSSGFFSIAGSGALWLLPLLPVAIVLALTAWWSWRSERRAPQASVWHRLIASVAAGLVASLVLLLLIVLLAPRTEEETGGFAVTSAGFRLAAVGTLLIAAASLAGREIARRTAPGEGLRIGFRRSRRALPSFIRELLALAAIFTAVFAPLVIVGGTVALIREDAASASPLLILLSLNIVALVVVLAQFGGVQVSAGTTGFSGVDELTTVFSAGQWWLWLAVLVALLTAAFAAVWIGTRRPRRTGLDLTRAWRLPLAVLVGWILFALLLFGASTAASGNVVLFSGDVHASISMALWSPLVLLLWAAVIELGAQTLPALVYGVSPRALERLAGRDAATEWVAGPRPAAPLAADGSVPAGGSVAGAPGWGGPGATGPGRAAPVDGDTAAYAAAPARPLSPRAKRTLLWTGAGVGVLAILGIGGAIVLSALNGARGPVAAAEEYVALIADGRAEAASELVDPNVANAERGLLTDDVLGAATERIEDVRVSEGTGDGDTRLVNVEYRLDGVTQTASLEVERLDNEWLFLERWRVATPLVAEAAVFAPDNRGARIGETELPFEQGGQAYVHLYPAVYEVEGAESEFFEADPARLVASTSPSVDSGMAQLEYRPTDALQAEVEEQVKTLIDGCAEQTVGQPEDCPFGVYVYPDDTSVAWKVTAYPKVEIADDGQYFQADGGTAEATYVDTGFFSDDEEVTDEQNISFSGGITIDGDEVTITDGGFWW
ncbi:hypothetical protein GCM10022219_21320 [Microbacterium oryzae]|uniref:DUF4878 domain-containing protein n=1 Tax=Microbacterium oryzae TaxID=743009 RepID=A0A6I6E5D9_9MICO|nr:hypothetical protein [Microbacterium oryzae]QGU27630.1 hypothetical protein D7D94_08085 [Microbacterium oryzae]